MTFLLLLSFQNQTSHKNNPYFQILHLQSNSQPTQIWFPLQPLYKTVLGMAPMTQYQSQRARASPWTPRHRWCLPRPSPEPLPFLTPSGTEFAQKTRVAQEWGREETEEERGGCCRQGEEQALQQCLGLSSHSGGTSHLLPLLPNVHNVCSQENINRRDFFSVHFKK